MAFPTGWPSDMDYQEAHGNGRQPHRTFGQAHTDMPADPPPAGETGRECSADEMTRAVFAALAKVNAKRAKGAA